MKTTIISFFVTSFAISGLLAQVTLTNDDRGKAIGHLEKTRAEIMYAVKDLNDAQLNFKASPDSWSVANCLEHITSSETFILGMVEKGLEGEANPAMRSEVKVTDDQIVTMITDRSQKAQAPEPLRPTEAFGSAETTLKTFVERRQQTIDFVANTQRDLRIHFLDFPFGKIDALQGLLFLSAHSERHLKQLLEVKANENFPK